MSQTAPPQGGCKLTLKDTVVTATLYFPAMEGTIPSPTPQDKVSKKKKGGVGWGAKTLLMVPPVISLHQKLKIAYRSQLQTVVLPMYSSLGMRHKTLKHILETLGTSSTL